MPSRLSWPVMGGSYHEHPTGVTLASGDPSNRFKCTLELAGMGVVLVGSWQLLSICPRGGARALVQDVLGGRGGVEGLGECRTVGLRQWPSSPQRKQHGGRRSYLTTGKAIDGEGSSP